MWGGRIPFIRTSKLRGEGVCGGQRATLTEWDACGAGPGVMGCSLLLQEVLGD